jgi:hypothetical protein
MSRKQVIEAFREHVAPGLRAAGFVGRGGHFVRRHGAVTHVVELQHSIYGGRFTVNLGLGLEWLHPQVRWVPEPALGPHAHDCTRWVRLGLVTPARADVWWSFTEEEGSLEDTAARLNADLDQYGLPWLEAESAQAAFLRFARDKLERSRSRQHPLGCFLELRLMAAVLAWSGERAEAEHFCQQAGALWNEERARMAEARRLYRHRHPDRAEGLVPVPDLQEELEALIAPTTGGAPFSASAAAAAARRSRSGPP